MEQYFTLQTLWTNAQKL